MQQNSALAVFAFVVALCAAVVELAGFALPYLTNLSDPAVFMRGANWVAMGLSALGLVLGAATRDYPRGRAALWISLIVLAITLFLAGFTFVTPISGSPT